MSTSPTTIDQRSGAVRLSRVGYWLSRNWLFPIGLLLGKWVSLPWLAPLFMKMGWTGPGKAIYLLYAAQCHQLPQRSFFLFGDNRMYSLTEVQEVWQNTNDPAILRQFTGDLATGWKVAWSDRMVYMYTTILLWGALFWSLRRRLRSLSWWGLILLLLPMAVDGFSHMVSDFTTGIGFGFRDSNAWLATLTSSAFPATFYAGDALGSFNSWMRLITGLLFSLGIVWTFYPRIHSGFSSTADQIEEKLQKAGLEA